MPVNGHGSRVAIMSSLPDYYAILQVDPRAEKEVIEAAYRRLAAKYHPDRNRSPEAAEKMKRINAAYDVLSNPEKRAAYDAVRHFGGPVPPHWGSAGEPPPTYGTTTRPWYLGRLRWLIATIVVVLFAFAVTRLPLIWVRYAPLIALVLIAGLILYYVWARSRPR